MSITFVLSVPGLHPEVNLANGNACALLAVAGLPVTPHGEVANPMVAGVVARLLRVVNVASARAGAITQEATPAATGRWTEGVRDDAYVEGRAHELLALFHGAQRGGCGVSWG